MICVTINQTIAQILIAEADALLFHHGETDHKPIPLPTGRISHNAAAANASASTAGDPKRHLKRWERVFLFYKEHISISGNPDVDGRAKLATSIMLVDCLGLVLTLGFALS